MPVHRVQALKVTTRILRRRFGWHALEVVSLAQDAKSGSHVVVPFAQMSEIAPVIRVAGFDLPDGITHWHRPSPRYRRDRALLSALPFALAAALQLAVGPLLPEEAGGWYPFVAAALATVALLFAARELFLSRHDRHAIDGERLYSRHGWLAPRLEIASRVKLHSVEIAQGPIARRRGYADLRFGVAGGTFAFTGVPLGEAGLIRDGVLHSIARIDFSRLPWLSGLAVGGREQVGPLGMAAEQRRDVAALRHDLEPLLARIGDQRLDQHLRHALPAHRRWDERVVRDPQRAHRPPGQHRGPVGSGQRGAVGAMARSSVRVTVIACVTPVSFLPRTPLQAMAFPMQFLSDNAAAVHPQVWDALHRADAADTPYDTDRLSAQLDDAFAGLFGREVAALWSATGTSANCLALATMVPPHGAVLCHREAHIETDECGAPGFYLHGAKLVLAEGEGAKLTPETIRARSRRFATTSTRRKSTPCRSPRPPNTAAATARTSSRRSTLRSAGATCGCTWTARASPMRSRSSTSLRPRLPARSTRSASVASRTAGMGAEAIVFFDPELADVARWRRKRAGALAVEGPLPRRAGPRLARGRPVAAQCRCRQCGRGRDRQRRGRTPAPPGRGQRSVPALHRRRARRAARAGLRLLRLGTRRRALRRRVGHPRGARARARPRHRRAVTAENPPHALLRPRIALPFLAISLIWGSTWYVITGQIDGVPAMWSVTWRFALATVGMFALVVVTRGQWRCRAARTCSRSRSGCASSAATTTSSTTPSCT
jgi:membrane protein YdbS with pleckstrin-like domain